jgi:hypothetical protein
MSPSSFTSNLSSKSAGSPPDQMMCVEPRAVRRSKSRRSRRFRRTRPPDCHSTGSASCHRRSPTSPSDRRSRGAPAGRTGMRRGPRVESTGMPSVFAPDRHRRRSRRRRICKSRRGFGSVLLSGGPGNSLEGLLLFERHHDTAGGPFREWSPSRSAIMGLPLCAPQFSSVQRSLP